MGSSSPRSSNSSTTYIDGEKHYLTHKGKDSEGVTEPFQLHDSALKDRKANLSMADRFFREAFKPMHLMHFRFFNNILDQFLYWSADQPIYATNGWLLDAEMIPFELFVEYFTRDENYLSQISIEDSPMRKVLEYDGIFVVRAAMAKAEGAEPMDENRSIIN